MRVYFKPDPRLKSGWPPLLCNSLVSGQSSRAEVKSTTPPSRAAPRRQHEAGHTVRLSPGPARGFCRQRGRSGRRRCRSRSAALPQEQGVRQSTQPLDAFGLLTQAGSCRALVRAHGGNGSESWPRDVLSSKLRTRGGGGDHNTLTLTKFSDSPVMLPPSC